MSDIDAPRRSRNLVARRTERVRREVATAAAELFAERGYDSTTVEDIAEAAEVSPRTFYRLFPAKSDVVIDISRNRGGDVVAALAERPADEPLLASIEAVFVARLVDIDPKALRSFEDLLARSPELRARFLEEGRRQQGLLAGVLAERQGGTSDDLRAQVLAGVIAATLRTALEYWNSSRPRREGPMATLREAMGVVGPILGD